MIEWRNAQPYSTTFQDVYFSTDDGIAETDYVFLQGNHLEKRWQSLHQFDFTIMETGFGTGLNFLCVCEKWLSFLANYSTSHHAPLLSTSLSKFQLHFISVEKFPLSLNDLKTAHDYFPQLQVFAKVLQMHYTEAIESQQPVTLFNGAITLTIFHGDAMQVLRNSHYIVDAWFLDGFSPAKNPDMWDTSLFAEMARLSKLSTTFATFTSASDVNRGLVSAGFKVHKRAGFGKKREMLIGEYIAPLPNQKMNQDAT
jgi:tRNA 5-methylaminomethyl-2-thiouridine biosynthesis bifunctional protein